MTTIFLNGTWNALCRFPNGRELSYDATVPGCAIHDLVQAGYLQNDLFWEKNADTLTAFESCDYVYRKHFCFEGDPSRATLVFDRIDTYADVYLNGERIYHSENGNIRHEIPVSHALLQGENELEVRLFSPVEWVKDRPKRDGAFTTERLHTRRMQCTYGWDWVARFVTCGIGACTLLLREADELPLDSVYIVTLDTDTESATLRVDLGFSEAYRGRIITLTVLSPEGETVVSVSRYCEEALLRTDLDVPSPRLWYPLGYGDQPIYTLTISDDGSLLHRECFGIRTVKIMQLPDAVGSQNYETCKKIQNETYDRNDAFSGFILKINGRRINCRGANWVPCVPYAMGDVSHRQTEILELCAEAGVNMLRVWGGGAFETEHFYNECSRLGITVTQDFLMACGSYPENEDWFIAELQREAFYAARLLRNQPCLVWWSGDNENAILGSDTDVDYKGRRSAYSGIAPVLYREDPYRRFLPSSPFGGKPYASNTVGTTHNTQYLGRLFSYFMKDEPSDYKEELKRYRARFIAEEPQLGAASLSTLKKFMREEDILSGDGMWIYHSKGNPALKTELFEYLSRFTQKMLGKFKNGADRLFKLRYVQHEWVRVVMEQFRRERALCSGIVFWMMNDCWPAASGWSLIDYYNKPKDAFYAFKRCAKPLTVSLDRENGILRVYASNDADREAIGRGRLSLLSQDGRSVARTWEIDVCCPAEATAEIFSLTDPITDGGLFVFDLETDLGHDRSFYRAGALFIKPALVDCSVNEETQTVTVRASEYLQAVMLDGEAVFEDSCFPLLPGECRTVSYRSINANTPITAIAYTVER